MTTTHTFSPSLQDQLGQRIAARLNADTLDLPHDITERLRAARTRAVAARLTPQTRLQTSQAVIGQNGTALLHFGDEGLNLWSRLASFFPLIALVAGLALISTFLDDDRANELAEIDSVLLTDDLPPAAYADPGFLQFLKNPIVLDKQE
jgi:Protein of unknown function (DUF3619)